MKNAVRAAALGAALMVGGFAWASSGGSVRPGSADLVAGSLMMSSHPQIPSIHVKDPLGRTPTGALLPTSLRETFEVRPAPPDEIPRVEGAVPHSAAGAPTSPSLAMAAHVAYQTWKATYVVSAGDGTLRVVRPQNQNDTVSEGIGYGMLLAVAHHDLPTFSGLWRYAEQFSDAHGLMNWDISASGRIVGTGSATDADEDMAYALLLAHQKWPGHGYGAMARQQIQALLAFDVSAHNRLLPGDSWGNTPVMNPSYISPAYYRSFAAFTGHARWDAVAQVNMQWLLANANPSTGLLPDWLDANGAPASIVGDQYPDAWYYNAVRVPWRLWMAAASGSEAAQQILHTEGQWLSHLRSPLTSGYTLSGQPLTNYQSGPFVSAAAFMGQFADAAVARTTLAQLTQWTPRTYYGASLRALALTTLAGELAPGNSQ